MKTTVFTFVLMAILFGFVSCTTTSHRELGVFPPSPSWSATENAVLKKTEEGNYVVKPSLVEYAIQAKKWVPRVERWKKENEIP